MIDVLTPEHRRKNMQHIRARDTKPEMIIRRGLHALGFRYRLYVKALPGCPDLVFPRHKVVIFVHGCFWHAHGCALSKVPVSRHDFWLKKLAGNTARDQAAIISLLNTGWRILVIWECAIRGRLRMDKSVIIDDAANFIKNSFEPFHEILGGFSGSI